MNDNVQPKCLQYYQSKKVGPVKISLSPKANSYLITKLNPGETYFNFSISAINEVGQHEDVYDIDVVTLLEGW